MTAPTLTSATPNQGPTVGGTSVSLIGTQLTTASAVKFGTAAATSFSVLSDTSIVAVAPAGSSGGVQITVTTGGGTSNGLTYTYRAVPTLTSAGPSQGPVSGGTSVTLTGSGFTGATAVKFGATAAASFTVVSDTQITAATPAGTAGPAVVTVTTAGGTSTANVYFYYIAAPTLAGVAPNQGPVAGGTSVTLTGAHFTGATSVKFGSAAASFGVLTDTQITALAPAGAAGTVNVTVTTAGGVSNSLTYSYVPVPTLTAAVPNQGPAVGGSSVTLLGSRLTTATSVLFGSTPAASFAVLSDAMVVAVAPAVSGTVQVTVTAVGGTSNGISYTGVAAPGI